MQAVSETEDEKRLLEMTRPELFKVEKTYKGPNVSLPLKKTHVDLMIESFKHNKVSLFTASKLDYKFAFLRNSVFAIRQLSSHLYYGSRGKKKI